MTRPASSGSSHSSHNGTASQPAPAVAGHVLATDLAPHFTRTEEWGSFDLGRRPLLGVRRGVIQA